ncbi:MAG: caspase family protein [Treponemataceae bacterium]|nr:caspase family protein [Treponemataceae bacterium]
MKTIKNISTLLLILIFCAESIFAADSSSNGTSIERYALYVASNKGGEDRETLKYAGTDAEGLAKTMIEIGGIRKQNSFILVDSTRDEIEGAFDNITSIIERNRYKAKRVEFIFYYSGHSDEEALLLGNEKYGYSDLKSDISKVPSDIHVVMLDSCFSGNFIRAKGGSRQKSFLMDDASVVQGHAYLSSSSESESSQESDLIGASYFTHSLITGLRGAADTSGDNRVSLNELYYYAFNDTLARTETSVIGPQHPSFNITLVGSGDLVLTDLSDAESMIILPAEAEGRYIVRTLDGKLASEVNKIRGSQLSVALPAGYYSVTVVTPVSTGQTNIRLTAGNSFRLASDGITQIPLTEGVARGGAVLSETAVDASSLMTDAAAVSGLAAGELSVSGASRIFGYEDSSLDSEEEIVLQRARRNAARSYGVNLGDDYYDDDYDDLTSATSAKVEYDPISVAVLPGIFIPDEYDNVNFGIGSIFISNENVQGFQISGLIGTVKKQLAGVQISGLMSKLNGTGNGIMISGALNTVKSDFRGIQYAGFGNFSSGDIRGTQIAGFMNRASGKLNGMQIAGFLNIAGNVQGSQIGFINIADSCSGASIGVFNFIKNGINSSSVFWENNGMGIQYQGGTKAFFTTFLASSIIPSEDDKSFVLGYGMGTQVGGGFINFDIELLGKYIFDPDYVLPKLENIGLSDNPSAGEAQATVIELVDGFQKRFYPSARITANMRFGSHFGIYASFNADLRVLGWNDKVFDYWDDEFSHYDFPVNGADCTVRTYWTFGIKF